MVEPNFVGLTTYMTGLVKGLTMVLTSISVIAIMLFTFVAVIYLLGRFLKEETFEEMEKENKKESYIEENITTESIHKAISKKTMERNMAKHYTYLLEQLDYLENELERLDIRDQHIIQETMKADLIALYDSYMQVDKSERSHVHDEVNRGLLHMRRQLDEIAESIQEKNKNEVRRKLAVIEKRYAD